MVAPRTGYVHDGQVYEKGDEVWDLGNWRHNSPNDSRYDYTGSESMAKLPPYAVAGATAFNPATNEAYCAYADPTDPTKTRWEQVS